jgi:hypothetical protein
MRIEIREAESSTSERPLWLWRVWCNGRMSQGFCPTESDATAQVKLEQSRLGHCWVPAPGPGRYN